MKKWMVLLLVIIGIAACKQEKEPVVSAIVLDRESLSLPVDGCVRLAVAVEPSGVPEPTLFWSSSDERVATVDPRGRVYGLAAGAATVTVSVGADGPTAICRVRVVPSGPEVYLGGDFYDGTGRVASYWKDGVPVVLPGGEDNMGGSGIFVSQGDVYVCGTESRVFGDVWRMAARYWKNGDEVLLDDGSFNTTASSIYVDRGDVYVSGSCNDSPGSDLRTAVCWKNGQPVRLTDGTEDAMVESVVVSEGVLYVGGSVVRNGRTQSVYWKDGVEVPLPGGEGCTLSSLTVTNGVVYACGKEWISSGRQRAVYWKNGVKTVLGEAKYISANQIFVSGNDIYVVGQIFDDAGEHYELVYWKNGVPVTVSRGETYFFSYSIFVSSGDVYVAGQLSLSEGGYWKNGELTSLGEGSSVSSIFVEER